MPSGVIAPDKHTSEEDPAILSLFLPINHPDEEKSKAAVACGLVKEGTHAIGLLIS